MSYMEQVLTLGQEEQEGREAVSTLVSKHEARVNSSGLISPIHPRAFLDLMGY